MKIVVSQSGKQYTYELLKALLKDGHEVTFITLFWFNPQHKLWNLLFKLLPYQFAERVKKQLAKKYDPALAKLHIIQAPLIELLRILSSKMPFLKRGEQSQFFFDRWHDRFAARKLAQMDFDLLIGYEMSSKNSFKVAKIKGAKTILDLAQIHYKEIERLASEYPSLSHLQTGNFRTKVNQIKDAEYQLADHFIVLSAFAKASMTKFGVPSSELSVANLGFNPSIFKAKTKTFKDFNKTPLKVLFVGAIIRRKGFIELLTAVSELILETHHQIEITLVGGLGDVADLEKFKGRVSYSHVPNQSHDSLKNYYQNADLFVFPSLLDSWAMVVLEAMASGTPVIVTENTGASDAVLKYGGGKIISAGDIGALKLAIMDYLQDPQKLLEDSEIAGRVSANYEWENYHLAIHKIVYAVSQNI